MKNVSNFHLAKVNLGELFSFCLIFCQFQLRVAYKSADYKKVLTYINFVVKILVSVHYNLK